jgi:hypothetical protein
MDGFFPSTLVDRFTDPTIPIAIRKLFVFGSVAPFMDIDVVTYVKKLGKIFLGMQHIIERCQSVKRRARSPLL